MKDFISEEKKKTPEYQSGIEALNDGVDCLMRRLNECVRTFWDVEIERAITVALPND